MKSYKIRTLQIILLISLYINASSKPILNEIYEANSRVRSGIAIGGIGTGSIELRKDGNFYNWTIFNNYPLSTGRFFSIAELPGKNSDKSLLFFLVRYQVEGQAPKLKLLQLNNSLQEGGLEGIAYYYPWMSGIEKIQYSARFPFSNLVFTDSEMPFDIEMEAFSPFIPHDVKNSSLPGAYFNFKITSRTTKKVDVMIVGSLRNLVGYDLIRKAFSSELVNEPDYKFFIHSASGMDETHDTFGQMGLGALGGNEVSYYLGWEHKHPYYEKLLIENRLANIDDTENRNYQLENITLGRMGSTDNDQRCFSSIAVSKILDAYNSVNCTFFMNWHFPNQYGAIQGKMNGTPSLSEREKQNFTVNLERTKFIGKYYSNYFSDIKSLADYFVANETDLRNRSKSFIEDMYTSDIELFVLDQINSHMNTFITSSTLTKNGQYAIREGLTTAQAWGPNSTSDVLLYASPMIIALFPDLQKSMMRTHAKLQTPDGEINHGLGFDPDYNQNGTWGVYERVDLVPNYIQMVLRDYLFTNDINYMKEMWPTIVKGINYILTKRDTNGDMMPDMHGIMCSYDNFPMYGLASYIQSQWIAALRMASIVAVDMGDKTLAKKYANIAKKGSELMDQKLWNGSYYNLSNDYTGNKGIDNGCLTDQLIGQWVAHNAGIGYLFDRQKVQKTLQSIMQKSFMHNSFLRNCSWPATPELFPIHTSDLWVDQANTPWTDVDNETAYRVDRRKVGETNWYTVAYRPRNETKTSLEATLSKPLSGAPNYGGGTLDSRSFPIVIQDMNKQEWHDYTAVDGPYEYRVAALKCVKEESTFASDPLSTYIYSPAVIVAPVHIYPNPVKGNAVVKFNIANDAKASLNLYDVNGKLVKNLGKNLSTEVNFDTSTLTPGMYFIRLDDTKGNSSITKVLIEK